MDEVGLDVVRLAAYLGDEVMESGCLRRRQTGRNPGLVEDPWDAQITHDLFLFDELGRVVIVGRVSSRDGDQR